MLASNPSYAFLKDSLFAFMSPGLLDWMIARCNISNNKKKEEGAGKGLYKILCGFEHFGNGSCNNLCPIKKGNWGISLNCGGVVHRGEYGVDHHCELLCGIAESSLVNVLGLISDGTKFDCGCGNFF